MNQDQLREALRMVSERINAAFAYCSEKYGNDNVLTRDLADSSNIIASVLAASNQSANELLGAKIRKLCDGGAFDLTDSPKSMLDTVVRLCAETANSEPEPCPDSSIGKHACKNRQQCWEPCGDLGHSEAHAKVYEPQAQAGEPEVVAFGVRFANTGKWNSVLVVGVDDEEIADHNPDLLLPLITLQSHREAMALNLNYIEFLEGDTAKKDAALKACVEALEKSQRYIETSSTSKLLPVLLPVLDANASAITQGQSALQ